MSTEREIHDGLRHLGTVRETAEGVFVAVIDEQVLGPFGTIRQATDSVLELARPGGGQ